SALARGGRHRAARPRGRARPDAGRAAARRRRGRGAGTMSAGVYLVGAGPGDPRLLTLRAPRCLPAAGGVLPDYLIGPRVLEHVRPDAEVIAVRRSHEERLDQAAIEAILIERVRDGKTVVRLKNGDPFLFGRGGEEAQALHRAGVPFEVVPGVSSALAVPAYAGIPLTHRDRASALTIA